MSKESVKNRRSCLRSQKNRQAILMHIGCMFFENSRLYNITIFFNCVNTAFGSLNLTIDNILSFMIK